MKDLNVRFPIEGTSVEVEFEEIPDDIVRKLVQRTLSVYLQHKYIKGYGDFLLQQKYRKDIGHYGILTVMDVDIIYREGD